MFVCYFYSFSEGVRLHFVWWTDEDCVSRCAKFLNHVILLHQSECTNICWIEDLPRNSTLAVSVVNMIAELRSMRFFEMNKIIMFDFMKEKWSVVKVRNSIIPYWAQVMQCWNEETNSIKWKWVGSRCLP